MTTGPRLLMPSAIQPQRLRCEHLEAPLGLDEERPRLGWVVGGTPPPARGLRQTAYRILVASTPERLAEDAGDLWDSGEVRSDRSTLVVYAGRPLPSRQPCHWKVKVWCVAPGIPGDTASDWSRPDFWSMGLLRPGDWSARWIGSPTGAAVEAAPLLRKAFTLDQPVRRAAVYVCGLGYHELRLNGLKVGDHVLDPKFTRYDRRALYVTHDVTSCLRAGPNAIGVMLGNGWFNYHVKNPWHFDEAPWRGAPRMILQLEIEHADGSRRTIVSDGSWRHADGPVRFDGLLNGETYDARHEKPGWDTAGHDDAAWDAARVVDAPAGRLAAQRVQPIRVVGAIRPVRLTRPRPGVWLFDLGQNIAGAAQLTVAGPAGTDVKIEYGERLHPDGTLDPTNIRTFCESGDFQTDHYVLRGGGPEVWSARFMYHGFQYAQVTGFPGEPTLDSLVGLVMHTDVEEAGRFECSNGLLNAIQSCTRWSYLNNLHGHPTDCPHREKIGWTGDAHIAAETGLYNFDPAAAYALWMRDFQDEQQPDGALPGIIPTGGWGYERWGGPAWCASCILIPWSLYRYRGDLRVLAESYDTMKRYVDHVAAASPDGINGQGMGDWFPAKTETPVEVTSTAYAYESARLLSRIAALLDRADDAAAYARLADRVREAFRHRFVDPATRTVAGGTQAAHACALDQGLLEAPEAEAAARHLAEDVERLDGHLDVGILGARHILHALTDHGRVDLAYRLATQTTWPSWGDMVRQGATTLWEGWNVDVGTHNHVMLGGISAWFFQALAGIGCDEDGPGFRKIVIRPRLAGDLAWVKAHHDSPYGRIVSNWSRGGGRLTMEVTIPANAAATVHVPASDADGVTESARPAAESEGVTFLRMEDDAAVYAVASGRYRFESRTPGLGAVLARSPGAVPAPA